MHLLNLRLAGLACALAGSLGFAGAACAAGDWPTRPITFLQPYGPGTALDSVTRYLATQLSPQFKVPIVVENRAGANGVIGTEAVARAPADGSMFLFTATGHFTNELLMPKVPYDSTRDFKPVARVASVMLVLVAPQASPVNSVRELIALARSQPGKLSYSSGGSGSSQHLSVAMFASMAGIDLLHVPYKTQAAALTDAVGGRVDLTFAAITTAAAQMKGGRLKAFAVTGSRRSQTLPELPTIAESGVPGYEFSAFNAIFVPARTPDDIVRRFTDALGDVVRGPGFAELARAQGIEVDYADAQAWAAAIPGEKKRWADMIRTSGARLE